MFSNCSSLKKLDISSFIIEDSLNRIEILNNCKALKNASIVKKLLKINDSSNNSCLII